MPCLSTSAIMAWWAMPEITLGPCQSVWFIKAAAFTPLHCHCWHPLSLSLILTSPLLSLRLFLPSLLFFLSFFHSFLFFLSVRLSLSVYPSVLFYRVFYIAVLARKCVCRLLPQFAILLISLYFAYVVAKINCGKRLRSFKKRITNTGSKAHLR